MNEVASLLYKTGPFGLLVVFLFVMERRTRSLLVGNLKKPVGVAVYMLNWVTIFLLCIVTVVIWIRLNVPDKEATIKGRLIGLKPTESLASPFENLYLRRVYGSDTHSDYVWRIISNSQLSSGASVPLYVDRSVPGHEDVQIFELKIDAGFYTGDVSLTYDSATMNLQVTDAAGHHPIRRISQTTTVVEPSVFARLRNWVADSLLLRAQSPTATDSISIRLQADDPVVRLTARDDLAARGVSGVNYIDEILSDQKSTYRLRVGVIIALNKMNNVGDHLSRQARCSIIGAAKDPDVLLSEQAAAYLAKTPAVRATDCSADSSRSTRGSPPAVAASPILTTSSGVLGVLRREPAKKKGGISVVSGLYAVDPRTKFESKVRDGVATDIFRCLPELSPNARFLLFCTLRLVKATDKRSKDLRESVYHWLDLRTGTDSELDLGAVEATEFSFSADGGQISFQGYPKHVSTFATNLFTYSFDNRRVTQVTRATEDDGFRTPVFSPSLKELAAFEVFGHPLTAARLVIVDAVSGTTKPLIDFSRKDGGILDWIPTDVAWSPTGKMLAFVQGGALNVVSNDGTGFRRIVTLVREGNVGSLEDKVRWSPRGDRISFSHANKVYSVLPDGSDLQSITDGTIMSWTASAPMFSLPR